MPIPCTIIDDFGIRDMVLTRLVAISNGYLNVIEGSVAELESSPLRRAHCHSIKRIHCCVMKTSAFWASDKRVKSVFAVRRSVIAQLTSKVGMEMSQSDWFHISTNRLSNGANVLTRLIKLCWISTPSDSSFSKGFSGVLEIFKGLCRNTAMALSFTQDESLQY